AVKTTSSADGASANITAGDDGRCDETKAPSEGGTFTRGGSFTDTDTVSHTYHATVDYGDGGGPMTLDIGEGNTFSLSHVYVDSGAFRVQIIVKDETGGSGNTAFTVNVKDTAPTATITGGDTTG